MTIQKITASMLLLTFAAAPLLAETAGFDKRGAQREFQDGINQSQQSGISTNLAALDAILDTRMALAAADKRAAGKRRPAPPKTPRRDPRGPLLPPKESVAARRDKLAKDGRLQRDTPPVAAAGHAGFPFDAKRPLTVAQVRKLFFYGKPLARMTKQERRDLRRAHEWLLQNPGVLAFLRAVNRVEGSPTAKTVVGGIRRKPKGCAEKIRRLDLSGHAVEQQLPGPCFLRTKAGPSSAFGLFQFVWSTFKRIKSERTGFGFRDFSRRTQAVAALELIRQTSPEGFVLMVRRQPHEAIRRGASQPWAGSSESSLPGYKQPIHNYVDQEMNKIRRPDYYAGVYREYTDPSTD
ncbi:MAG: hypothetical protein JSS81_25250 [Acidobacteria bacterium]|nr:hypothetical protein [Acidobacteriota bacterium]